VFLPKHKFIENVLHLGGSFYLIPQHQRLNYTAISRMWIKHISEEEFKI